MTEFNYLIHGSLLFAGGLAVGLIGALLVTRRGRAAQHEVAREKTADRELPEDTKAASDSRIPTLDTPRAAAMPIPSLRPAHAEPPEPEPLNDAPLGRHVSERSGRYENSGMDQVADRDAMHESMRESNHQNDIRDEPLLTNPRTEPHRARRAVAMDDAEPTGRSADADAQQQAASPYESQSTASPTPSPTPSKDDPDFADPEHVARTLRRALISGGKPKAGADKSRPLDVDDDVGIS